MTPNEARTLVNDILYACTTSRGLIPPLAIAVIASGGGAIRPVQNDRISNVQNSVEPQVLQTLGHSAGYCTLPLFRFTG